MSRILGLDLGAHSVKALLLESNFRSFTVRSFTEVKLQPETGLKGALEALKADGKLAADQVIVATPGCSVATHLLTLPFTDPRRIEATLGFEVEGQLPYDISEVVYDHQQLLARADGKSEILVGVVRNEEMTNLLTLLNECGVDPRVITTSAVAYQNLLSAGVLAGADAASPESVEAIVDIGHERTSIAIGRASLEYARTFQGGGRDLTRAVANEFKVSHEDAQAWKENEGDLSLGEGDTPLIHAPRLARAIGVRELFLKYEGANPTGSFKDRGMVVAVAKALEAGATSVICASTGNTSASAAA
ncbi:MAG: pyridoxal-phosphate dependent enzyme, partial [Myxococcales bacterium]